MKVRELLSALKSCDQNVDIVLDTGNDLVDLTVVAHGTDGNDDWLYILSNEALEGEPTRDMDDWLATRGHPTDLEG